MSQRKAITEITAPVAAGSPDTPLAVHYANESQGGLKTFATLTERDDFTKKFQPRLFKSVALVNVGENNYPSLYTWTGTKPDGTDGAWAFAGYFGGMVIADVDGALTRVDSTAVLGPDFTIEAAGDTGNGVLIQLSSKLKQSMAQGGSSGITVEERQTYKEYDNIKRVLVGPGLDLSELRESQDGPVTGVSIAVKGGLFEPHRAEGYLAYFDMDEMILGNTVPSAGRRKGAIWADSIAWGSNNTDLYPERETKSVILQEADNKDPNVTGGAPILCGLHLGFYGKAPQEGTIECKLVDATSGNILEDASGQPIGIIHHYKKGDELKPLTAVQVYKAKGAVKGSWVPSHTFTDDPVRLEDWAVAGSCMMFQQLGNGEAISPVINEFQAIIGKPIKVMQKYYGVSFASNKWALSFDAPKQTVLAGSASDSVIGVDFENPTDVSVTVESGIFNVKDVGKLASFSLAVELSEEDTRNLRGKTVTVRTEVFNRLSATTLCMLVYTGNLKDITRPVFTGMSNDSFTLSAGWDNHDRAFLPEHPEGLFHPIEKDFLIPNAAGIVMFAVIPQQMQNPMDVSIKPIEVDVKEPFTSYEVSVSPGSDQLQFQIVNSQFVTNLKIWGVNPTKTNLPMGERPSTTSKAPVKLFAEEDDAGAYRGGIILEDVTEYKIELWLSVSNYFKTKLTKDETLRFWVEDESGDVVSDSEASLVLKDGDYMTHLVNWHFDYTTVQKDTKLRLYGQSSSKKVGFLTNGAYNAAGVSVDAKVVP